MSAESAVSAEPAVSVEPAVSAEPAVIKDLPCSFMAKTTRGKKRQRAEYRRAQQILKELNKSNARRRKDKRKKSEQVRVAIGDPMAPYGRDKKKVFRPLYNVQTMTDVETDFVFAYSVTPTLSDSGHLVPMIDQMTAVTGRPLETVLTDSGYPSGDELAQCKPRNVDVIALGMRTASPPRSEPRLERTGRSGRTNSPGIRRFPVIVAPKGIR